MKDNRSRVSTICLWCAVALLGVLFWAVAFNNMDLLDESDEVVLDNCIDGTMRATIPEHGSGVYHASTVKPIQGLEPREFPINVEYDYSYLLGIGSISCEVVAGRLDMAKCKTEVLDVLEKEHCPVDKLEIISRIRGRIVFRYRCKEEVNEED